MSVFFFHTHPRCCAAGALNDIAATRVVDDDDEDDLVKVLDEVIIMCAVCLRVWLTHSMCDM